MTTLGSLADLRDASPFAEHPVAQIRRCLLTLEYNLGITTVAAEAIMEAREALRELESLAVVGPDPEPHPAYCGCDDCWHADAAEADAHDSRVAGIEGGE